MGRNKNLEDDKMWKSACFVVGKLSVGLILGLGLCGEVGAQAGLLKQHQLFSRMGGRYHYLGAWSTPVGDTNRDGWPDFAVLAWGDSGMKVNNYVTLRSGRDGSELWKVSWNSTTFPAAHLWRGLAGCGDVNGDGVPDLAVGIDISRTVRGGYGQGRVEFLSGKDGRVVATLKGPKPKEDFGSTLAVLHGPKGKVAALVVGSPAEIIQRTPIFLLGVVRVYALPSRKLLYTTKGTTDNSFYGEALAGLGDIDGDGYEDLVVGASERNRSFSQNGYVEVLSGRSGKRLFFIRGRGPWGSGFGTSVAGIGDVDGDSVPDLLVGAPDANILMPRHPDKHGVGYAWVLSMKNGTLIREHAGSIPYQYLGSGVAGIGDIDGDGVPDYAILTPRKIPAPAFGKILLYSGKTGKLIRYLASGDLHPKGVLFRVPLINIGDLDRDGQEDLWTSINHWMYNKDEGAYLVVSPRAKRLVRWSEEISLSMGGTQRFYLDAGRKHAGKFYWMLGSTKGVLPGLWLGKSFLPLNPDAYFLNLLTSPNALMPASLGLLDSKGKAALAWTLPRGLPPSLLGLRLDHAYLVLGLKPLRLELASNPVPFLFGK